MSVGTINASSASTSSATASRDCSVRPANTTLAPAIANSLHKTLPMPPAAPVITATVSLRSKRAIYGSEKNRMANYAFNHP